MSLMRSRQNLEGSILFCICDDSNYSIIQPQNAFSFKMAQQRETMLWINYLIINLQDFSFIISQPTLVPWMFSTNLDEEMTMIRNLQSSSLPDSLSIYFDMFKTIVALGLCWMSAAVLQVYSPICSVDKIPNSIQYTLSNFGEIPYGETIIGQIYVPKDPELCNTSNQASVSSKDATTKSILLVKRGTCKFTQKVINAQNLGADLIIIYDNNEGSTPSIIMKNDGHGHLAEIPSLFISNTHGKKLQATDSTCSKLPLMRIVFELDQAETSDVTLWLDAGNVTDYRLRDKHIYWLVISTETVTTQLQKTEQIYRFGKFVPYFRFRVENNCEDWICSKDDCIGILTEMYCRNVEKPDSPDVPHTKGSDLVNQQLREYYLWEQVKDTNNKEMWWHYMGKFDHNVCLELKDVEDCSYTTMAQVGFSSSVIEEVKKGVETTKRNIGQRKSTILKQSYEESKELGIYFYPEATINDRNFYGLFKAPQVFEAICNSLINPPSECIKFIKQNHEIDTRDQGEGMWKSILVILGLMTLGFLVALFIYTKVIKREVNQQLSVQVNKMVQKYVNMVGKKGDSSSNSYNKFDN